MAEEQWAESRGDAEGDHDARERRQLTRRRNTGLRTDEFTRTSLGFLHFQLERRFSREPVLSGTYRHADRHPLVTVVPGSNDAMLPLEVQKKCRCDLGYAARCRTSELLGVLRDTYSAMSSRSWPRFSRAARMAAALEQARARRELSVALAAATSAVLTSVLSAMAGVYHRSWAGMNGAPHRRCRTPHHRSVRCPRCRSEPEDLEHAPLVHMRADSKNFRTLHYRPFVEDTGRSQSIRSVQMSIVPARLDSKTICSPSGAQRACMSWP